MHIQHRGTPTSTLKITMRNISASFIYSGAGFDVYTLEFKRMVNQWTLFERVKDVLFEAPATFPPTDCTCITDHSIHRVWIDGHTFRAATAQSPDYERARANSDATAAADTQQHHQTDGRTLHAAFAGGGIRGVTHGTH